MIIKGNVRPGESAQQQSNTKMRPEVDKGFVFKQCWGKYTGHRPECLFCFEREEVCKCTSVVRA